MTMSRTAWLRRAAAAAIVVGALTIALPSEATKGTRVVDRSGDGAPWDRRMNSPIVESPEASSRAFHELHLAREPNAAGFRVVGVRKGVTPHTLEVEGANVFARAHGRGAPATGTALIGVVLDLRDAADERYALEIAGAGSTTYWAGALEAVSTYVLTYTSEALAEPQPLCNTGVNEAILFAGDRYDAARKTVTATGAATGGWFNIACAGTALAKLFLTRHTEASQTLRTTAAERQAMLKMFTADVCGDGTTFTVHGQPLLWADSKGVTSFARPPGSLEAIWTDRGALCLDTPRRPELAGAIAARCGARLPRCAELPEAARAEGYVISATPRWGPVVLSGEFPISSVRRKP